MNLQKHGDKWRAFVYLGTINGKQHRPTKTFDHPHTRAGKKAATKEALAWAATLETPTNTDNQTRTVADLLDAWQQARQASWSIKHRAHTKQWCDTKILPTLANTPINDLTPNDLERLYTELLTSGGAKGQPLAPSSVKRVHIILRAAYNTAIKWGWADHNPVTLAQPPKLRSNEIRPPSIGQIQQAVEAAHGPPWPTYLRLAYTTGARLSEILGLQWADVDVAGRRITINRGVTAADGAIEIKAPKNGERRLLAIDGDTGDMLKRWAETQQLDADTARQTVDGESFVFASGADPGRPMHPDSVRNWWRRLRSKVPALEGVRLHDLRHFAATQMLSASIPIHIVSHRLGHKDVATTLRVYVHFMPAADRDAAELMGDILLPTETGV